MAVIPAFGPSGVLPPYVGTDPANRPSMSPYGASMTDIVDRFAISSERIAILRGLLAYRAALAGIGIVNGSQWIDGSFVEDCETIWNRPPSDVDIVTFAYRPQAASAGQDWAQVIHANLDIFDPMRAKAIFKCDAYYIDLNKAAHLMVSDTAYFNGLFSHQRSTRLWKGMISVSLSSDDAAAWRMIRGSGNA